MTDKAIEYADKLEKVFGMNDYASEMRRLHEENKQAVEAEREACAKVCELIAINAADNRASECAIAIRARGQK